MGATDIDPIVLDRTSSCMVLRSRVAEALSCRPHQIRMLNQCTVISPTDTLEQANIDADVELQIVVEEDPLAKFLDVSYKWLSKYASAPSVAELEQFVQGGWQTFDACDKISVEDAGGDDRGACLDFIRAQAEGFSNALDAGEDFTASWWGGMNSDVGTWYNVDVDNFLERAQACTGLVSSRSIGVEYSSEEAGEEEDDGKDDVDDQSESASATLRVMISWNDIRRFFGAGQSYE